MDDEHKNQLSYKSQVSSQSILFPNRKTMGADISSKDPITHSPRGHIAKRINRYEVATATTAASELESLTSHIAHNHNLIELGVRYHGNPAFARTYDVYAKCRNLFGSQVHTPSLPALLDLQEETLNDYATCLNQITTYVDSQQEAIIQEVNMMEKQLGNHNPREVQEQIVRLRSELGHANTHSERRDITNQLYEKDRLAQNISHSQDFFDQYVNQETLLRDVGHSLRLLTDQTVLFETYISKSKGFFVSVNGIGQVVAHMSPVVSKMKTQTMQLQDNANVVTSYLEQKSTEPLFEQKSVLALAQR